MKEKINLIVPVEIEYGSTRKTRRALAVDLAVHLIEEDCPLAGGCGGAAYGVGARLCGEIKVQKREPKKELKQAVSVFPPHKMITFKR